MDILKYFDFTNFIFCNNYIDDTFLMIMNCTNSLILHLILFKFCAYQKTENSTLIYNI
jgi:hypothetical protein